MAHQTWFAALNCSHPAADSHRQLPGGSHEVRGFRTCRRQLGLCNDSRDRPKRPNAFDCLIDREADDAERDRSTVFLDAWLADQRRDNRRELARGRADVIRALGENDLNSSAAAINWETARRAATDNWARQVRTKNQLRDEYVAREKAQHPVLTISQQQQITHLRDPKRLSPEQLSAAGAIRWPSVLRAAEFDQARARLDELFAERARGFSGGGIEIMREVDAVAIEMTKTLEQSESDIPVMAQVDAKKFLAGLRLEAHLRPDAAGNGQVASASK